MFDLILTDWYKGVTDIRSHTKESVITQGGGNRHQILCTGVGLVPVDINNRHIDTFDEFDKWQHPSAVSLVIKYMGGGTKYKLIKYKIKLT